MNLLSFRRVALLMPWRRHFSARALTMQDVVSNFYERTQEVTVDSVAKTMAEMLQTHMTLEEHKEYHPLAEELTYYVVRLLNDPKAYVTA